MTLHLDPALAALIQGTDTKPAPSKTKGYFIRTKSVLDGTDILAVIQLGATRNEKIGDMAQLWIMPAAVIPSHSKKTGEDAAVCGGCWFRKTGTCYVNMAGVNAVYSSVQRGNYIELTESPEDLMILASAVFSRSVRLGAWGDPAAVPWSILSTIVNNAKGHTGYTHQFNHPNFDPRVADVCMVSVENPREAARLQRSGYRTFRPRATGGDLLAHEIECPSEKLSCAECRLCDGKQGARGNYSVSLPVHGQGYKIERFNEAWGRIDVTNI